MRKNKLLPQFFRKFLSLFGVSAPITTIEFEKINFTVYLNRNVNLFAFLNERLEKTQQINTSSILFDSSLSMSKETTSYISQTHETTVQK